MKRELIFLGLLIASFLAGCAFYNWYVKRAKSNLPTYPTVVRDTIKADTVYQDKAGKFHFDFVKPKPLEKTVIKKIDSYTDSLAMALSVKPKQIEQDTKIIAEVKVDSINFLKNQVDSLKRIIYSFNSKSINLTVRSGNPADTSDKGSFDLKVNTSLNVTEYNTRKNFLSAQVHHTIISPADSFITIKGLQNFSFVKKEPFFGLRLGVRLNYNFISNAYSPGVYFRFDANRLSLQGNYYYNLQSQRATPILSIGYDFKRF